MCGESHQSDSIQIVWERTEITPPISGVSAMFWRCLSCNGIGTLTEIDGNIDSAKYISVLDEFLWPVVVKNFPNKSWIFQEDNCPVHQSITTRTWKEENNISTLN